MSGFRSIRVEEPTYLPLRRSLDRLAWALGTKEGLGSHAKLQDTLAALPALIDRMLEGTPELMRGYGPSVELREIEVTR